MRVIIMRHGDAMFSGADRVLSLQGQQEARVTGLKLASSFSITKIFTSPKQRAIQTAEIVKSNLRGRSIPEIEILPELSPCGDACSVQDYVEAICEKDDNVLLVSHIPQVVNLAYTFCRQELALPIFSTAGALVLEQDALNNYQPVIFHTPSRETTFDTLKQYAAKNYVNFALRNNAVESGMAMSAM